MQRETGSEARPDQDQPWRRQARAGVGGEPPTPVLL